jgi:mRNA interferase RelE/StbE
LDTKKWKLFWSKAALKDLDSISHSDSELIKHKVTDYLLKDPVRIGKPLKHFHKGTYSYRIGLYRVLYSIDKEDVVVLVVKVGKRDEVYQLREEEIFYATLNQI